MMNAPRWFTRELQLIDPNYFAWHDDRKHKWYIRKIKAGFLNRANLENSVPICSIPYPNLDSRIIMDLKRGLYFARHAKELIQQIDENNARLIEQSNIEDTYISKYMAKKIYAYYREKTLDLGNRNLAPKAVGLGEY